MNYSSEEEDELSPTQKITIANWAQTPYLRQALQGQQLRDPDAIFGAVKPIQLEGTLLLRVKIFTRNKTFSRINRVLRNYVPAPVLVTGVALIA